MASLRPHTSEPRLAPSCYCTKWSARPCEKKCPVAARPLHNPVTTTRRHSKRQNRTSCRRQIDSNQGRSPQRAGTLTRSYEGSTFSHSPWPPPPRKRLPGRTAPRWRQTHGWVASHQDPVQNLTHPHPPATPQRRRPLFCASQIHIGPMGRLGPMGPITTAHHEPRLTPTTFLTAGTFRARGSRGGRVKAASRRRRDSLSNGGR